MLSPAAGSCYALVPPSSIAFAGDSSGAGICLAVKQAILSFHRISGDTESKVRFNGQDIAITLPAGFAGLSIYAD